MDKIKLLQQRRADVLAVGKDIRKAIASLVDADSFVELSGFSFSKNEFYDSNIAEDGVVAGFATIDGYAVYIAAQNFNVLHGGVSSGNCAKIRRCQELAEKNSTPIIYVLNSLGVQIGEGITVLEGMASVLSKSAKMHGVVPQFAIVNGEAYGQISLLAASADFTFFMKDGILAPNSPLVLSAKSGKNLPKEEVGGAHALSKANLVSFEAQDLAEVRSDIVKILSVLPEYSPQIIDDGADLNAAAPTLNDGATAENLISAVFDAETAVEIGRGFAQEVRCVLGRVGGIAAAGIVFDDAAPVSLNENNVAKITAFAEFAAYYDLPFVTFVNAAGIRPDLETVGSLAYKNIFKLMETYDLLENAKISVVYKNAIGLGYTLFAAKSIGFDYVYAFADAKIALFDSVQGAEIEFADEKGADKKKLEARYSDETSDPIHAAKNGYVDNIIEPQFVKQYLIASLQMLQK